MTAEILLEQLKAQLACPACGKRFPKQIKVPQHGCENRYFNASKGGVARLAEYSAKRN